MEVVGDILFVAEKMQTIHDFYDFIDDIHDFAQCDEEECFFGRYLKSLKNVVDAEGYEHSKMNLFIRQSVKHHQAFSTLRSLHGIGKEKVKDLIRNIILIIDQFEQHDSK